MDTEIFTAFKDLNTNIHDHRIYVEKRLDEHAKKLTEICTYIKTKKEIKSEQSENTNKKFYIAIAVIGVGFGILQYAQGMF